MDEITSHFSVNVIQRTGLTVICYFKVSAIKSLTILAAVFSMACFSTFAYAQLGEQTGIADPGRIEKTLTDRPSIPQNASKIRVKEPRLIQAPEGADNIRFKLSNVQIDGSDIYDTTTTSSLYINKIGRIITLTELYDIANKLTLMYRNDGYILTQVIVPPQTIENGIVRLRVIEGFIDTVTIKGDKEPGSALKTIQNYASRITQGDALNIKNMERYLLLINDLPGITSRAVISPSTTITGAADLTLIIERDPYEALAQIDNHGSRFLGPLQFSGIGILNSFFGLNETITTQLVMAPDGGELGFGSLTYEQPVGPYGTTLSFTGGMSVTDPGYTLRQFDVKGQSRSMSLRLKHPFLRSRETNLYGSLQLDWRDVDSKNNIEPTRKDRLRILRTGIQAEFLDRLLGTAINSLDITISQGLGILGASKEGESNLSRASADPAFTKTELRFQRLQRITNTINLLFEGRGQLSNNPLPSSEEFGIGGISTVRGYAPSEIVGDDGILGKIEAQWNTPYDILQIYGFLDSGTVWNQDATNSADKRESITSTGGGLRLDLPADFNAELIAAQPVNRDVDTQNERDPQFFFSLSKKF